MIKVTGIDNQEFYLNSSMIYRIDQAPDTVITLSDGKAIMVMESIDEIIERIKTFQRDVFQMNHLQSDK
ncbi:MULTISPECIES: flagellar FlbD family protein [Vagococcus]|uniref:flagellar FlbD family protein n=1 Tax=Vagococcus TaxID=2737 RepID=UPI002FC99496